MWIYWETQPRAPQQTCAALRSVGAYHPWVSPDKVGSGSMATAGTAEAKYSQAVCCCCRGLQERGLALRISREKGRAEGVGSPPRSWRVPGRILTTVGKTKNKVRQGLHFVIHHQHPAFRVLCPRTGRGGGFPPARRPLGPRKAELGQGRGVTEQEVSLTHALVLRRTCNGLGQAAFKTRPERKIRGQV